MTALPKVNPADYAGLVCPYCQQRNLRWYHSYERKGMVYVVCETCGSSGPFQDSQEKALAMWMSIARQVQPMPVAEAEQVLDGLSTPNFHRLVGLVAERLRQESHGG